MQKKTQSLLEKAYQHLIKVDERMQPLIEQYPCHLFSPEGLVEKTEPFEGLVSSIISQQVSVIAAKSIKARFIEFFNQQDRTRQFPRPLQVATTLPTHLRNTGLSQRKVEYIKGLAEKFISGELTTQMLYAMSFKELFEKLILVRGLGKWSIEMFAMFGLKKTDIFSVDDLGIQRGMATFFGRESTPLNAKNSKCKYMPKKDMLQLSEKFAPYRSLFMWFMWRVASVKGSTVACK